MPLLVAASARSCRSSIAAPRRWRRCSATWLASGATSLDEPRGRAARAGSRCSSRTPSQTPPATSGIATRAPSSSPAASAGARTREARPPAAGRLAGPRPPCVARRSEPVRRQLPGDAAGRPEDVGEHGERLAQQLLATAARPRDGRRSPAGRRAGAARAAPPRARRRRRRARRARRRSRRRPAPRQAPRDRSPPRPQARLRSPRRSAAQRRARRRLQGLGGRRARARGFRFPVAPGSWSTVPIDRLNRPECPSSARALATDLVQRGAVWYRRCSACPEDPA